MLGLIAVLSLAVSQPPLAPDLASAGAAILAQAGSTRSETVVLNCALGSPTLTDCRVVGESTARAGEAAVRLAEQVASPVLTSADKPRRVELRLRITP